MPDKLEKHLEAWLDDNQLRVGARMIIVNATRDHFLVEKNLDTRDQYMNFIGGGVELGETFEETILREISEETDAIITRMEYLFVVENFIHFKGETIHGLGHYFDVEIDRMEVKSLLEEIELIWLPINEVTQADLRPHVVRDAIANSTYRSARRLISRDVIQ